MSSIQRDLKKVQQLRRKKSHAIIHQVHQRHKISHRTLFYIKEYGPHSHIPRTILRESIIILLIASFVSSLGGFAFENIKSLFLHLVPFVILFPALNDMIGDYSGIISSKFTSMLYQGKIHGRWWKDRSLRMLGIQILLIALFTSFFSVIIALFISSFLAYTFTFGTALKIMAIALVDVAFLVAVLFFTAVYAGISIYKKQEDPNNFLIPLTTSLADFGNMIFLTILILIFF